MGKEFRIKDFLIRIKDQIIIEDDTTYKRVTVSGNHKGVKLRDEVIGALIGTKKQFVIKAKDFILSKIDARNGAFGIIPDELDGAIITGNFWTYSVDTDLIDTEWFFYFTHSYNFIQICIESSTGSTHRKYLDEKVFLNHKIFVPEIKEQKQMVKRYKSSSKISKKLSLEISSQKEYLFQLKQSILQEAIQGKLTEEWRTARQAQESPLEEASELLKRIKAEKAQLVKEKKIRKEKALPPISDEEIPFDLPEGWVWTKLGDICTKTGSGSTPRGGKSAYIEAGIPFIRSQNVYDGGLRLSGVAYIPMATHKKMKGTKVQAEDLLLNITGGSIGRCCIVPKDFKTGNINQHVAIIRTLIKSNGYFIHKVVCSPYFQNMIYEAQTGAGREGLPKNKMDNILIALPPLEEQQEIVKKVEVLMEHCEELEKEVAESEANAQMLMQAVLKEAFEGEIKKEMV
ncbi:hypothetical protein CW751_08020 [Brumimicrobium salinarum]|uniref:Type I restriction modification DNA specificity domain-containing protein n=1 Tax=Brumimicrobium salinarum TaxID=2058658 RepID=A0A2I0R2B0_9FLAO|nr:restriction endonuclease subunit S [Brumimicrobium salinarum]PKR80707.1 hypothetical protein CW751_08020 [Brumimicrobium salinarum]